MFGPGGGSSGNLAGMAGSGSSGNLSVMSAGGSIYGMSPYSTSPLSVSGGGSAYLYQVRLGSSC